ncbi:PKD domain-containing protein [[Eubacterium] cellulosolvens]
MKLMKSFWKLVIIEILIILITSNFAISSTNTNNKNTDSRDAIKNAISSGVAWLASQQKQDGSWGATYYPIAQTGFVLTKLQEYAYEMGYSPFDEDYIYYKNVINGWKFLFKTNTTTKIPINIYKLSLSPQKHGTVYNDPDTNSNGYGLYFYGTVSYTTGICLMALEASGTPNRVNDGGIDFNGDNSPDTFFEIAQDIVDWIAFAQCDSGSGEGGWDYAYINNSSGSPDNSNSGYIMLGLAAGEEFGCTVPEWVRERLNVWINNIQDPVDGDANGYDGGSHYRVGYGSSNLLRTGNLIFEMTFYGDAPTTERFEAALDYIERHWHDDIYTYQDWGYEQNISYYQTMFCLMKGLEYSGIDYLDLNNDSIPEHDWYNEFASVLVAQQEINGSWPKSTYSYYDKILSTCWALLTLEKVIPPENKNFFQIPPIPNVGGPYTSFEGSPIEFNGSGSKDLNDDVLKYRWDFNGDGIWDTPWSLNPNATYTFGDDWVGVAILKVAEINTSKNYTAIDKALVTVKNVEPKIRTTQNLTIYENKSVTLFAEAVDPGSDDLSFEWHWADSNITSSYSTYLNLPPNPDSYPSLEVNPRLVNDTIRCNLIDNGLYRVTVIVKDDDGDVAINNIFITVDIPTPENITPDEPPKDNEPLNKPPEALVKGSPLVGVVPLLVYLNGYGFDIDGTIVSYSWDYGDGHTYSDLVYLPNNTINTNSGHHYEEPGIYCVTFSVVDDKGASDKDWLSITIEERPLEEKSIFTISGYVYKASSSKRIAQVHIKTLNITVFTDHSGFYSIEVPKGIYTLDVSKSGYESTSTTISVSSDTNLDFYLKPIERSPRDTGTNISTFWNWAWILIIVAIIASIIITGFTKRKLNSKKKQQLESGEDISKIDPPHVPQPKITAVSIIKKPTLVKSSSPAPLLPDTKQTPSQKSTSPSNTVTPPTPKLTQPGQTPTVKK